MPFLQSTYAETQALGVPGQKATSEEWNIKSRVNESTAMGFGQPCFQGSDQDGVIVGATQAGTGTPAAVAGNTGNGTMGAVTVADGAKLGSYRVTIVEPAANAGAFIVTDPDGIDVGNGDVGVAFTGGGISFTLADGATDFAAGDQFTVAVALTANAIFLGISVRDHVLPRNAAGNADEWPVRETVPVMTQGVIWVTAGAAVAAGARAFWDPATKKYTSVVTNVPIVNGRFDSTAAADGDMVKLSIRNR